MLHPRNGPLYTPTLLEAHPYLILCCEERIIICYVPRGETILLRLKMNLYAFCTTRRTPISYEPRGGSLFIGSEVNPYFHVPTWWMLICYAPRRMLISYDPRGGCLLLMLLEVDLYLFCEADIYLSGPVRWTLISYNSQMDSYL